VDCLAVGHRFGMPTLHRVNAPELYAALARDARISDLFFAAGPLDVRRLVMSVVVDPLEGQAAVWTTPHVLKESVKGRSPSFAHSDTSSAVVLKSLALRIAAPLNHLLPQVVFAGLAHAVRLFSGLATARPRRRSPQRSDEHRTLHATHAPATQIAQTTVSARLLKQHGPVTGLCSLWNRAKQVRSTSRHFTSNFTGERDV
jgi:hypothetical protein